jgi:AcrR family transcriptional regulator
VPAEPGPQGRRRRTPRNTLSADLIIDATLRLLDARGTDSFSMRALAEELDVGTMALYTYFRGKDELFQAARDRVLAGFRPPETDGTCREQLRAACLAVYRLLTDRPAVLRLLAERPIEGDEATAVVNRMLELLRGAGLDRQSAARTQLALIHYTIGAALWSVRGDDCRAPERRRRLLARLAGLSADSYPALVDLAPELACVHDPAAQYEFGLDLMLAGLPGE